MANEKLYKITTIARPLDPAYGTNKAVLFIMPAGAIAALVQAAMRGTNITEMITAAIVGLLIIFGSWALGRELAPDDNVSAFLSMVFAFITYMVAGAPSLLLLFTCLFLTRIVNRTVGPPARLGDSIFVVLLTVVTAHLTDCPLLGAVGALAFVFDAILRAPERRQWLFASLCLLGPVVGWFFLTNRYFDSHLAAPIGPEAWLVAFISIIYTVSYLRTTAVESVGDITGVTLSLTRVRAGMFVGLLVPAQALLLGSKGLIIASAVWATLAGVGVGHMIGYFKPDRLSET